MVWRALPFLRCLRHAERQTGDDWVEWEEAGLQTELAAVILWLQTEQIEEDAEERTKSKKCKD